MTESSPSYPSLILEFDLNRFPIFDVELIPEKDPYWHWGTKCLEREKLDSWSSVLSESYLDQKGEMQKTIDKQKLQLNIVGRLEKGAALIHLQWYKRATRKRKTPFSSWRGLRWWKTMGSVYYSPPNFLFTSITVFLFPFMQELSCGLPWLQTLNWNCNLLLIQSKSALFFFFLEK